MTAPAAIVPKAHSAASQSESMEFSSLFARPYE